MPIAGLNQPRPGLKVSVRRVSTTDSSEAPRASQPRNTALASISIAKGVPPAAVGFISQWCRKMGPIHHRSGARPRQQPMQWLCKRAAISVLPHLHAPCLSAPSVPQAQGLGRLARGCCAAAGADQDFEAWLAANLPGATSGGNSRQRSRRRQQQQLQQQQQQEKQGDAAAMQGRGPISAQQPGAALRSGTGHGPHPGQVFHARSSTAAPRAPLQSSQGGEERVHVTQLLETLQRCAQEYPL